MSLYFNGQMLTTPQSMSVFDDSALGNKNPDVGNVAGFVGRADGGKPFTVLEFGSYDEAKAMLKGDATVLKAFQRAFDPSAETGSPQKIVFVRINPATQAVLTLKDAADKAAIDLVSTDYGRVNNQVKVKVEAGSIRGKKLTTAFGNGYYSDDNIARSAFDVRYAGAEATATITITNTAATLKAGATITTLDLTDVDTVQKVVDRINTTLGFTANVLDDSGDSPSLMGLDSVTDLDCKTAAAVVTANLQACIDWINGAGEGFVTATRSANAGAAPKNIAFTYLAGATDGEVTNAEWQKGFDALQQYDVQWLTPLSPLPAIHAMADTHAAFMSNRTMLKRRVICGGAVGATDLDAIAAAKLLASDRTSLTHLGGYDYNDSNKLTLYPPYIVAASLAGMFAGVGPGTALTNKASKWRGLERKVRNPTDTDALIKGGVLVLEDGANGVKIVKSISTWRKDGRYNRVEQSTGAAADYLQRSLQEVIDTNRGKKNTPLLLRDTLSRAETELVRLAQAEPVGPGILVGDEDNPPFRKLTGSIDGDAIRISVEASVVVPNNYMLLTVNASVFGS